MAIDINGVTLIVTLEAGITELDVAKDLYEPWKLWLLGNNSNLKFPPLFRPLGGDPLTSIINAGSYFFLNNTAGWRLKPPEEDITIWVTGNFAVEDVTVDSVIPTDGAFTAAIFGLQPITQGVTPLMGTQLGNISFQGAVCIDPVNGFSGTGTAPNGQLIGTRQAPSNNVADTHTILDSRGLTVINLVNSMTGVYQLTGEDLSSGYSFVGDSPHLVLTIAPSADVSNCSLRNLTVEGELDGLNTVRDCSVLNVTNVSGYFEKVAFKGTLSQNGQLDAYDCFSQVAGGGYPVIKPFNHALIVRNLKGSLGIAEASSGHLSSIGLKEGRLVAEATCTGGEIHGRGQPFEIVDNSAIGCEVLDETEGYKVRDIHGQVQRSVHINTEALVNGNGYQQFPFNNFTDAVDYAEANGILHLIVLADADIDRQLKNFTIIGIGTPLIDCGGFNLDKSEISRCKVTGFYTGSLVAQDCSLLGNFTLNGFFDNCAVGSTFTIPDGGTAFVKDCSALVVGAVPPSFDVGTATGTANLVVTGFDGGFNLLNVNQPTDDVKLVMNVSKVVVDASCTDGEIRIAGNTKLINNGTGSVVYDETLDPEHLHDIWKRMGLKIGSPVTNKDDGGFTVEGVVVNGTTLGTDVIQTRNS